MVISEKYKYIFISNPKTATTSIQRFLLNNDESAYQNKIIIKGKKYNFREHHTAAKVKEILGEEYNKFMVFGFIRAPHSKLVSAYHFYKNGKPITKNTNIQKRLENSIKIIIAKLLPFKLWSLLFPYKSNKEYFTNDNGSIIVNWIGVYENINDDLECILKKINLPNTGSGLTFENSSTHMGYENYIGDTIVDRLIRKKIYEDIKFFEYVMSNKSNLVDE